MPYDNWWKPYKLEKIATPYPIRKCGRVSDHKIDFNTSWCKIRGYLFYVQRAKYNPR